MTNEIKSEFLNIYWWLSKCAGALLWQKFNTVVHRKFLRIFPVSWIRIQVVKNDQEKLKNTEEMYCFDDWRS
jgi:hypothetical protein